MRPESLNSRITIERPSTGQDAIGQPIDGWTEVIKLWADIRGRRGIEVIKSDKPTAVVSASIRIWYRTGLDASMRVVHGDTVYRILALLPDEQTREYLDLVCEVVE